MRILVLTTAPRQPDNHLLWEGLRTLADVELHCVPKEEQRDLITILRRFDLCSYDRVVLDLLFRHVSRHAGLLSRVPGLVLYEEDACQEFIPGSRWHGRFSAFYRNVRHARVIFTGYQITGRFRDMGVDAHFLPKGYDSSKLYDEQKERDIPLGFIGRLGSNAYQERRDFLHWAAEKHGVQILRTETGDEYRRALNRIRVFVSADIGLGEYMAKNFEAMACGCALLARRQGGGEEEALGLEDGRQVLLYDDKKQFEQQLQRLQTEPQLRERLAANGTLLAKKYFDYGMQGRQLMQILQPAMSPVAARSLSIRQRLEQLFANWGGKL